MKVFNILLGLLFVVLIAASCQKEVEPIITSEDTQSETATYQLKDPNAPCGSTGYDILWHFNEERCIEYGHFWYRNRCFICR